MQPPAPMKVTTRNTAALLALIFIFNLSTERSLRCLYLARELDWKALLQGSRGRCDSASFYDEAPTLLRPFRALLLSVSVVIRNE